MWQSVFPFGTHFGGRITFRRTDCHVALVLLAMTAETLETYATDQRFANSEVGWLRRNFYLPWQRTPRALPPVTLRVPVGAQHAERMEAVRAPRALLPAMLRISVRAQHAMRDLIASNAPLRNGSHKARQNGPKHYPGDPTGAAAPLVCLSSISFFKQRKISPPEGLPKTECR